MFGKDFKLPKRQFDNDPHTALFWKLIDEKDADYSKEASQLMVELSLEKNIGRFRIEYWIKDGEAGYSMFDTSDSDLLVAGMEGPIPDNKRKLVADLKEYLAHSEATARLESI